MMYGWYGSGAWITMALMMLVALGGLVTVLVLVLRRPPSESGVQPPLQSPLQPPAQTPLQPPRSPVHDAERILGERFARGEIDEAEYKSRRAILRQTE